MCLAALRISGETVDSARYKSIFNYYNYFGCMQLVGVCDRAGFLRKLLI